MGLECETMARAWSSLSSILPAQLMLGVLLDNAWLGPCAPRSLLLFQETGRGTARPVAGGQNGKWYPGTSQPPAQSRVLGWGSVLPWGPPLPVL